MHIYHDRRFLIPFRSALLPQIFTDVLVIGTGVAGLRTAIEAAAHGDVIVLAKEAVDLSNTSWAQGGIAAVLSDQDTVASHVADTLEAGAGLCDIGAVNALVDEGRQEIARLLEWGMRIDRAADGSPALGLEGGHHHARIVHTDGDATGYELARCLIERVRATRGIRVFDRCFVIDLLRAADGTGRVLGALSWHPRYGLQIIWARATVLASGGAGQVFRETTNPKVATGDGVAMAWRAGAAHVRRIRRVAMQLQTEIRLDGCAEINGASWILPPATIRALLQTQVANNFLQRLHTIAPVRHC